MPDSALIAALKRIDPNAFVHAYTDGDGKAHLTVDGSFEIEKLVSEGSDVLAQLKVMAKMLVESVYDDNKAHGDILSRDTIAAANALHAELELWK